jgi:hypothetical protein
VDQDLRRTVELYQQTADRGNAQVICNLGRCWEDGRIRVVRPSSSSRRPTWDTGMRCSIWPGAINAGSCRGALPAGKRRLINVWNVRVCVFVGETRMIGFFAVWRDIIIRRGRSLKTDHGLYHLFISVILYTQPWQHRTFCTCQSILFG